MQYLISVWIYGETCAFSWILLLLKEGSKTSSSPVQNLFLLKCRLYRPQGVWKPWTLHWSSRWHFSHEGHIFVFLKTCGNGKQWNSCLKLKKKAFKRVVLKKTHCSKSSYFVQKFNFDFPRKLSNFFGGEKLVKMLWFCTF